MDMDQTDSQVKVVYVDRKPDPLDFDTLRKHVVQYGRDKLSRMSRAMQYGTWIVSQYLAYVRDNHSGLATVASAQQYVAWGGRTDNMNDEENNAHLAVAAVLILWAAALLIHLILVTRP